MSTGSVTHEEERLHWLDYAVGLTVLGMAAAWIYFKHASPNLIPSLILMGMGPGVCLLGFYIARKSNSRPGHVSAVETCAMFVFLFGGVITLHGYGPKYAEQLTDMLADIGGHETYPPLVTLAVTQPIESIPADPNVGGMVKGTPKFLSIAGIGKDESGKIVVPDDSIVILQILQSKRIKTSELGEQPNVYVTNGLNGKVWWELEDSQFSSRADPF